jgi:phosphoribosyl 1,2-cyclic phosphodiesterase
MIAPLDQRPPEVGLGLTVLGSGSRGNALVLHGPEGGVLVDAGFSLTELRRRLDTARVPLDWLRAILITHEHTDHTEGLRLLARLLGIPVFCNRLTADAIRATDRAPDGAMNLFTSGAPFDLFGFRVEPFSIPHDAADPTAFVLHAQGRKVAIATDLGHANHLAHHHLQDCDLLVLESNHDVDLLMRSRRPMGVKHRILSRHGHLSNEACMQLLRLVLRPRTRHVILAHASEECNRYELIERCASACLAGAGRRDIAPLVARQHEVLPTLWV